MTFIQGQHFFTFSINVKPVHNILAYTISKISWIISQILSVDKECLSLITPSDFRVSP